MIYNRSQLTLTEYGYENPIRRKTTMTDKTQEKSFDEKFEEVGAAWPDGDTRLNLRFKTDITNGTQVYAFKNKFHEENEKAPLWRLFTVKGE